MKVISQLYRWYGKRTVWGVGVLLVVLVAASIVLSITNGNNTEEQERQLRSVAVASVASLSGSDGLSLVGEVEAVSQAEVASEVSGRIVSVPVQLGSSVRSGQVIAQFENSRERASVLQAEGAYEAAVAAAASTDVSVSEAKNGAVNTYRNAYTAVTDVLFNTVDQLYGNPRSTTPGLRIAGGAYVTYLNNERYALNALIENWQNNTETTNTSSDLNARLSEVEAIVVRTQGIVNAFIEQLTKQDATGAFSNSEIATLQSQFATAESKLNSTLASINSAQNALARASVSGSGGIISSADAQVKQALGSLRLAQSALAKTIVRAPISGVINAIDVKVGDFVGVQSRVAMVANNDALRITTFISEQDRGRIAVGDTVTINNRYEGVVTTIAPAIDPATKKIEVQISTEAEELSNGDTVRVAVDPQEETVSDVEEIIVPITALKVETDRTIAFTVDENGMLIAHPVEIGPLLGDRVIILSGIEQEMEIVRDARGLNEGDQVEAVRG